MINSGQSLTMASLKKTYTHAMIPEPCQTAVCIIHKHPTLKVIRGVEPTVEVNTDTQFINTEIDIRPRPTSLRGLTL